MRFEARELKPYAEPVSAEQLKVGEIYFSLQFHDEEMLIPILEPFVFLSRNLIPEAPDHLVFQTVESYRQGIRYETATEENYLDFQGGTEENINHIFEYERALDGLMSCALRRRKASKS
ncbi:MAG: hypothetical protein L0Z53_11220 [Acidobacteriales bacterium]|nr:hypothetical protein [Terriglobales bacterium]